MDVGKSIRVSLAKSGKRNSWLASEIGVTRQQISNLSKRKTASAATITKISAALNLKASEFIAIGEE